MDELLGALQNNALIEALRLWRWAYPALNAAHITGIALLFGAIAPLDLRIAGAWQSVPLSALARVLKPVAVTGLVLALLTGPLLFLVDPAKYAANPFFWAKLSLIAFSLINLTMVERALKDLRRDEDWGDPARTGWGLKLGAMISILLWLGVIVCGRFIAYV